MARIRQNAGRKSNNEWFYFDERGYCLINRWFNDGKDWFYLDKRGAMVTGWMFLNHAGISSSQMVAWLLDG